MQTEPRMRKARGTITCMSMIMLCLPFLLGSDFHTDPSRWKEPRIYHTPGERQWEKRVTVEETLTPHALMEPVHSPNRAYYYMLAQPDTKKPGPWDAVLYVHRERPKLTALTFHDFYANFPVEARWINEKLLFVRVWWGRTVGTDAVYDVEKNVFVSRETFHEGTIVYRQYHPDS